MDRPVIVVIAVHHRRQKSMGSHHSRGIYQSTPTTPVRLGNQLLPSLLASANLGFPSILVKLQINFFYVILKILKSAFISKTGLHVFYQYCRTLLQSKLKMSVCCTLKHSPLSFSFVITYRLSVYATVSSSVQATLSRPALSGSTHRSSCCHTIITEIPTTFHTILRQQWHRQHKLLYTRRSPQLTSTAAGHPCLRT